MASARRTGTSESVSTYAASGADYSALGTWESATDNDNVTGTVSPVLECASGTYNDRVDINGATNNSTYFRIIRPNSSSFHSGIRDTGVRFYSTVDNTVIALLDTNDQVQDVVVKATYSSVTTRGHLVLSTGCVDAAFVGCIVTGSSNSGTGSAAGAAANANATNQCFLIDILTENNEGSQVLIASAASVAPVLYNVTAIGGAVGFNMGASSTITAKNCLAHGMSTADWSGSIDTGSNNASEDTTAMGTSPRISQTFTFVNAAGFDYHLAVTDAGARDFGTDLSADATYPFNDDIDRHPFLTWDIGVDECVSLSLLRPKPYIVSQAVQRAASW